MGFIILLGVSFLCRINLDNNILLVSYVDLLKTKFTISLSEPSCRLPFPPLEMKIFLFQLKFSSVEPTEAFTTSSDQASVSLVGKKERAR